MRILGFFAAALVLAVQAEPPARDYLPPTAGGYPSGPSGIGGYPGPSTPGFPPSGGAPGGGIGGYPGPSSPGNGGAPGGAGGDGSDGPTEPANYEFSYEVKDEASGNDFGHSESRQGDVATGRYYVLLPDGRKQIVEYTADSEGYKPKITYEGEANTGAGGPGGAGGYPSGPSAPPSSGYPGSTGGLPTPPGSGSGYPANTGGLPSPPGSGSGYPGSSPPGTGYPSGPGSSGGFPTPPGTGSTGGYRY